MQLSQRLKEKAIRETERAGFVLCYDPEPYSTVIADLQDVFRILLEEISSTPLEALFLFDMKDQSRVCDGWSNTTTTPEGEQFSAIGLSLQAIDRGADYLQFLFIHELTHLMLPAECNHGEDFHSLLDYLLDKFNRATGKHLVNDYMGYHRNATRGHRTRD